MPNTAINFKETASVFVLQKLLFWTVLVENCSENICKILDVLKLKLYACNFTKWILPHFLNSQQRNRLPIASLDRVRCIVNCPIELDESKWQQLVNNFKHRVDVALIYENKNGIVTLFFCSQYLDLLNFIFCCF